MSSVYVCPTLVFSDDGLPSHFTSSIGCRWQNHMKPEALCIHLAFISNRQTSFNQSAHSHHDGFATKMVLQTRVDDS